MRRDTDMPAEERLREVRELFRLNHVAEKLTLADRQALICIYRRMLKKEMNEHGAE